MVDWKVSSKLTKTSLSSRTSTLATSKRDTAILRFSTGVSPNSFGSPTWVATATIEGACAVAVGSPAYSACALIGCPWAVFVRRSGQTDRFPRLHLELWGRPLRPPGSLRRRLRSRPSHGGQPATSYDVVRRLHL